MITPRFRLTQTETSLVMRIEAPFSRVADADVFMDGRDFRFHAAPYYLRLHLPGDIVEDDRASATFDADANWCAVRIQESRGLLAERVGWAPVANEVILDQ